MTAEIQDGAIVKWQPSTDLHKIFPRNTAFRLYKMVPLIGKVDQVAGNAAIFFFNGPHGREHIPVLLSECTLPEVPRVAE